MWIDSTSGEDELGLVGGVVPGSEKCATSTGEAGSGSDAGAADIVMWGS